MTLRIIATGLVHAFLYLYMVPFVLFPLFGDNGFIIAVAVALVLSVAIFGTLLIEKRRKGERDGRN